MEEFGCEYEGWPYASSLLVERLQDAGVNLTEESARRACFSLLGAFGPDDSAVDPGWFECMGIMTREAELVEWIVHAWALRVDMVRHRLPGSVAAVQATRKAVQHIRKSVACLPGGV